MEVIYSIHIKTQGHSLVLQFRVNREHDGIKKRGAQHEDVKGYEGRRGAGKAGMGREG